MSTATDLHVHSTFSTYDGMGSPQAVVNRAVELGWGAVALTEHGHMASAPALYQAAKKAGIKPIIGCEMYVVPDDDLHDGDKEVQKQRRHLTVLALNFEGYQNLVTWMNYSMERPAYYNGSRISLERMLDVAPWPLHHNVILSGCMGGELCQCLAHESGTEQYAATSYIESCKTVFPNFYIELQNHTLPKYMERGLTSYETMVTGQAAVRENLLELSATLDVPVIVTNDSHFQAQEQRPAHLAMLSRKQWRRASEAHEGITHDSQASTFAAEYIYWMSYMRPLEKIAATLPDWAEREAIQSIHDIVEEANVTLEPLDNFSYTVPSSGSPSPVDEIRRRSKSRLKTMVLRHGHAAQERFDYELSAMEEFADYLVLVADVVKMSRDAGIYTWTRGSAANSLVCFCLRIHDIDPIHYRLMFERFVNPARTKLPDVDLDIEGARRDDLARMVKEHMAEIEGDDNVRGLCTYSTINNRNAFRLMAEAAGVSAERIDELAKLLPQMIDSGLVTSDEEAYEMLKDEYPDLYELVSNVFDSVGGFSQHACAYVIGTRERPLSTWVPNYRIGSSDAVVTQYNMKAIEDMGFLKLDLLKLDSLTIMHSVARMLGKDIKWLDSISSPELGIYELDDKTLKLLQSGHTAGIHSFQGATQRRGCLEVAPENIEDMVAIQALYRPSGTRTGLDKAYVNRKHGREDWASTNEFVGEFLDETYAIAIYQEQIMEMGAAMGMSGEEIDDLYKAIKTAKGVGRGARELFEGFEPTFRKYSDNLWPKDQADEVWAEWEKMQGYSFNRGHATSYAIIGAAKMGYLAAHHPQEFYVALLDRYPNNPRYLAAAIAAGFHFTAPDVNASGGSFAKGADDKSIRIGLLRINGVGPGAVSEIVRNQPFASVSDLRERTSSQRVKQPTIDALAAVGALESLGIQGESDDLVDFALMTFIPRRPDVFQKIKVQVGKRRKGSWEYRGLERGVDVTHGKAFCSKLFWLPPVDDNFTTKASITGQVNAHLLTVVDENGIPFDLMVPVIERKKAECDLIRLLDKKCDDAVICAEGQIGMPFLRGGNTVFKLWDITGASSENPQIWGVDFDTAKLICYLANEKNQKERGK